MHLTPEDLKRLKERWLAEGWSLGVVLGTIRGMEWENLARKGQEFLKSNGGTGTSTTPTNGNT